MNTLPAANDAFKPNGQYDVDPNDEEVLDLARAVANRLLDAGISPSGLPETLRTPLDALYAHDQILNGAITQLIPNADALDLLNLEDPASVEHYILRLLKIGSDLNLPQFASLILECKSVFDGFGYSRISQSFHRSRKEEEFQYIKYISDATDAAHSKYYKNFSYFEHYRQTSQWLRVRPDVLSLVNQR